MQNLFFLEHIAGLVLALSAKARHNILFFVFTKVVELPFALVACRVAIGADHAAVLALSRLDLFDRAPDAILVHVGDRKNVMLVLSEAVMIQVPLIDSWRTSAAPAIALASHLSALQALVMEETLFYAAVGLEANLAGADDVGLVVVVANWIGYWKLFRLEEFRQGEQVIYEWFVFLECYRNLAAFEQVQELSRSEDGRLSRLDRLHLNINMGFRRSVVQDDFQVMLVDVFE